MKASNVILAGVCGMALAVAACEKKPAAGASGTTPGSESHGRSQAAPADAAAGGTSVDKDGTGETPAPAPQEPAKAPAGETPAPAPAPEPAPALPGGPVPAEQQTPSAPVVREDGLVIEELVIGDGPAVHKGAAVIVHYRGTLKSDGSEFDSSYKRGQPAAFPLDRLIKGWQEGIPGMKPGGKRKLTVPWALAYGEAGRPPTIPPKADLVFEIELVDFVRIEDTKVGDGAECKPGQTVRVYYRGTLKSDGKEFDSNMGDEPIEFPLGDLIPGWQYGIPGMKVGGTRKLTIPWQFAYGERGSPPVIPGKADLVFEIQLLGTK